MKFLLCSVLLFLTVTCCYGNVFDSIDVSSKARGMGGAWAASADDAMALLYNPASLFRVESADACVAYLKPNQQNFESLTFLAFSFPEWKRQKFGVSYRHFGVDYQDVSLLTESTLTFGHALSVLKDIHTQLLLGYALNVYMLEFGATKTQDLGEQSSFGLDIGVLGILRERTRLGLFLRNVNEPSVGKYRREPIPQWVTVGVAYQPYYGVVTELDIRASRGQKTEVLVGMQFSVVEALDLRFGFQTEPHTLTGGFTVNLNQFALDYAYSSHTALPGTHHISLRANLVRK